MSAIAILRQLTPASPVAHTLSRVVASDHTPIGIPRNVRVHPGPSGRIFDTTDRKLEETFRGFLFDMSSPPITQVVNNSGYSTCFGREVKRKIFSECMAVLFAKPIAV